MGQCDQKDQTKQSASFGNQTNDVNDTINLQPLKYGARLTTRTFDSCENNTHQHNTYEDVTRLYKTPNVSINHLIDLIV